MNLGREVIMKAHTPRIRSWLAAGAVLAALAAGAASAADIWRWVDEAGKVHYGDSVPDKYKSVAKRVHAKDAVSDEDLRAAQERANRDKGKLQELRSTRKVAAPTPPPGGADPNKKLSCADQWQRYNESSACFESYRIGGNRTVGVPPPSDIGVPTPPLVDGKPPPSGSVIRNTRPISPEAAENCTAYPKPEETTCPAPQ
jgi:hypothetical protein